MISRIYPRDLARFARPGRAIVHSRANMSTSSTPPARPVPVLLAEIARLRLERDKWRHLAEHTERCECSSDPYSSRSVLVCSRCHGLIYAPGNEPG